MMFTRFGSVFVVSVTNIPKNIYIVSQINAGMFMMNISYFNRMEGGKFEGANKEDFSC